MSSFLSLYHACVTLPNPSSSTIMYWVQYPIALRGILSSQRNSLSLDTGTSPPTPCLTTNKRYSSSPQTRNHVGVLNSDLGSLQTGKDCFLFTFPFFVCSADSIPLTYALRSQHLLSALSPFFELVSICDSLLGASYCFRKLPHVRLQLNNKCNGVSL